MKKLLIVFGTRPEAIKMAPLVHALRGHAGRVETRVCVTAQHRGMLDQVLDFFGIVPDYDLDLMRPGQTLTTITADILTGMSPVLAEFKPDMVLVHGDTTTSMAAALAAFYAGAKVAHIEAGLRTGDKWSPFPEEINRRLTGQLADLHLAPTEGARQNLLKENIDPTAIAVTGNTVIDALLMGLEKVGQAGYRNAEIEGLKSLLKEGREVVLVTGHRRENHGEGMQRMFEALREIADVNPRVQIVYPVHPNPNVKGPAERMLAGHERITLIEPLGYPAFIWLMERVKLIITDSGGIQEEAPSLGKPVLVTRETTERPEAVEAGTVILVGTDRARIAREASRLLNDKEAYSRMSRLHNPYGDGKACEKIVKTLFDVLDIRL